MPGNPYKPAFKSPNRRPKVSAPQRPKVTKASGASQMPGGNAVKAQATAAVKAPNVRVTSKAGSKKKATKIGPGCGGPPIQQPGNTGVKNTKLWEGPATPR